MQPKLLGMPAYRWIAETLRGQIVEGRYRPGDALPSLPALAVELGVSRDTLRSGLSVLRAEGMIDCQRGYRARVRVQPRRKLIDRAVGQTAIARMPTDAGRVALNIPEGTPVLVMGGRMVRADQFVVLNDRSVRRAGLRPSDGGPDITP